MTKTDQTVIDGMDALQKGSFKEAKDHFEVACQIEESEKRDPKQNEGIVILLAQLTAAEELSILEKTAPEKFAEIEKIANGSESKID